MFQITVKLVLFIACILVIANNSFSQKKEDNLLTVKQIQSDLKYWYKTILNVHPNPYLVLTPGELDIKVQELIKSIDTPMSKFNFFIKIRTLQPYFDAHSWIFYPQDFWEFTDNTLPTFFIELKNGDFYFSNNPLINSTLQNQKIKNINHISCNMLIDLAKKYISFEEYDKKYLPFDAIMWWQHIYGVSDSLTIEYEKRK